MTKEEIMKLEGRELDKEITIKVMGLDEWHTFSEFQKPYSSDMTAAWEVVEEFKGRGYLFSLKNIVAGEYTFSLTDWKGNCSTYSSQRKTAPEAICHAALLAAMEVEK